MVFGHLFTDYEKTGNFGVIKVSGESGVERRASRVASWVSVNFFPAKAYLSGMHGKILIVVGGPTASGKTGFAIRLARHFDTHIVSCDSRQFFREMSIGTAKPDAEELAAAPHHFIGHLSIEATYSVGDYERDALAVLDRLFAQKDIVILTGGSGLYLKALCEGLDSFPDVPTAVREEVEQLYHVHGLTALQEALREVDPVYFEQVDRQNPHRLIRALSVYRASGRPFSSFRRDRPSGRSFKPLYLQMHWPRPLLYERINQRVVRMVEAGLLAEARELYPFRNHTALQTVGYREVFDYLEEARAWDTTVALIQRNTRRYAKRQLTWMRRDGFWKHFHPSEWEMVLEYIATATADEWQWSEHRPPWPPAFHGLFDENDPQRPEDRLLALHAESELLGALLIRSHKKYLSFDAPHFARNFPSYQQRLFLHEAVARAEEAAIYAQFPAEYHPWLLEWGFSRIDDKDPPALRGSSDSGAGDGWLYRPVIC